MGWGGRCHLGLPTGLQGKRHYPHFLEDWACEEIVFSVNVVTITPAFTEQ